jgi:hypothetical protein
MCAIYVGCRARVDKRKILHSEYANDKTCFMDCHTQAQLYKFEVILTMHRHQYVEIKCQLDATDVFYCRSYCLLNMFRAPIFPSSGAREYYTVGCHLWSLVLGFQVVGMAWS